MMKRIFIVVTILGVLLLSACGTQHGKSVDTIYGYDTGIVWNHLYLTNDHTTTYCYQDPTLNIILEQALQNKSKVEVTYSKYIIKGSLCQSGTSSDGERVVVDNVKIVG